jgi:hypothetical protein
MVRGVREFRDDFRDDTDRRRDEFIDDDRFDDMIDDERDRRFEEDEIIRREDERIALNEASLSRKALKQIYEGAYVGGAALGGGPAAAAAMKLFLKTPAGKELINKQIDFTYRGGARRSSQSTGRERIRSSGQFRRDRILPRLPTRSQQKPKKRTSKQKASDSLQSKAFKQANAKLRKKNGSLKKGKTQADVAKLAQRILRALRK